MPFGSFCPCSCWLALLVDLADTHCRSIFLGPTDEPDPLGSSTRSCDSGLDFPPPQKNSHAAYPRVSYGPMLERDQDRIANLNYIYNRNDVEVV
jgi:hypothetical protein